MNGKRNQVWCLVLLACGAIACGDEGTSELIGIYTIEHWSLGKTCADVGVPVLAAQPVRLLEVAAVGGALDVNLCTDASKCSPAWRLPEGSDQAGWVGTQLNVGGEDETLCRANKERIQLSRTAAGEIRVEVRHHGEVYFERTQCSGDLTPPTDDPLIASAYDPGGGAEQCVPGSCDPARAAAVCESGGCIACELIGAVRSEE